MATAKADRNAIVFEKPVDLEMYPAYAAAVSEPMSLFCIKSKLEAMPPQYQSIDAFFRELTLIHANSVKYNGPANDLTASAAKLLRVGM
jgi:hypothetical protein